MNTSSKKAVTKKVAEETKKVEATTTAHNDTSTGATSRAKKRETKMKVPKKRHSKAQNSDDEADEDYVTFLNSINWRDYE